MAGPQWVEARTSKTAVVSEVGETQARRVTEQLDAFRAMLRSALGAAVTLPREPVTVLAVRDQRGLRELLPQFWETRGARPVGASAESPFTQYIALRLDVPEREQRTLLFHEYVHVVTRASVPNPRAWQDEGLSDFWASLDIRNGVLEVGRVPAEHLRSLRDGRWIPLAEILDVPPGQYDKDPRKVAMFYAQSWALVHYLLLGRGNGTSLRFSPSTDLGDPAELDQALRAYVKSAKFKLLQMPLPAQPVPTEAPIIREVPPAESFAVRGNFVVFGVRPDAAPPLLEKALKLDSKEPLALEAMGVYHFQRNEHDQAREWFRRAVDTGHASHRAHYYYALEMAGSPPLAEAHLKQTIRLDESFVPAYLRLADQVRREGGIVEFGRFFWNLDWVQRLFGLFWIFPVDP